MTTDVGISGIATQLALARMEWEYEISLLTDRATWLAMAKLFGITYLIMVLILGVALVGQGEWRAWLTLAQGMLYLMVGLMAATAVAMMLLMRNRMVMHYRIDNAAVFCESRVPALEHAAAYGFWLGLLIGKVKLGGKLRQAAHQSMTLEWNLISQARYDERRYRITLRNRWRDLVVLYCPPERYTAIAARIHAGLAHSHAPARQAKPSPLPQALRRSVLITLACTAPFALPYPFEQDVFIVIYLWGFSIAMVWILCLLGYAVLFGVVWSLGELVYAGWRVHTIHVPWEDGPVYWRGVEFVSGDEWLGVALCVVALGYLAWDAWRAVRGKAPSMLARDMLGEDS